MKPNTVWVAFSLVFMGCGGAATPAMQPIPPVPTEGDRIDEVAAAPDIVADAPPAASLPTAGGVDLDTVRAGRFDNGRMWTFEYPPTAYFEETYGFRPDSAWLRKARLGALRIPGCSASFVSPNGLVLTNHHCSREHVSAVARPGETLLDDGFYASTLGEERSIEGFEADRLIAIRDVSDEMDAALVGIADAQARSEARGAGEEEIGARITEEFGGEAAGIEVEMISLYNGGRYSAYVFRRYTDVRMVMAPELSIGYFGGDPDNFTYPRYSLDFSFLRVYDDDGTPLDTSENYFPWSETGVSAGDAIFVIGNPGSTSRIQTVAELEFRRDVSDKGLLGFVDSRIEALQAYYDLDPETGEEMDLRNSIFSLLNTQKAYRGIISGLHDPVIIAKRRDQESAFQEAIDADAGLAAEYGSLIEQMAALQEQKAEQAEGFGAFLAFTNPEFTGSALVRALFAFQYIGASRGGAPPQALAGLLDELKGVPEQPKELQELLLAARFQDVVDNYGADAPLTQQLLGGRTAEGLAAVILAGSALVDSAGAVAAVEGGSIDMDDPGVQAMAAVISGIAPFQQALGSISPQETEIAAQLGRARFEVYGTDVPPDATFSLRIADGVVTAYEYNGTVAPVVTTFYGLYDRYYSQVAGKTGADEWELPDRWVDAPSSLDLTTPINFVSTADIIGGNSGSPLLNRDLEIVGLAFDGNIESLSGEYIFQTDRARTVSVDARGILEAIEEIYRADRIVEELRAAAGARR